MSVGKYIVYNSVWCCVQDEQFTEALSACGGALELQRDARILCDKGDALIGLDMFEDGTGFIDNHHHTCFYLDYILSLHLKAQGLPLAI